MNNQIKQCAQTLNQAILDDPLVKEYKKYKQEIDLHPEYLELETQIKNIQKKIIQSKDKGLDTDDLEKEYEVLKNRFMSNPIINNYMVLKEDLDNLLSSINHSINQYLQDE